MTQQPSEEPEIVRINISLSTDARERLHALADEYYSGNVSELVRAAVRDHQQTTLEGEGQVTLELIKSELANNSEILEEILELLQMMQEDRQSAPDKSSGGSNEHADYVLKYLLEEPAPVSQAKLLRELDLSPMAVRDAVGTLLDMGAIEVDDQGSEAQYRPKAITGGGH